MQISIEKAVKEYKGRNVLNVENIIFREGLVYAILGHNGCGKSTLLNCIGGLESLSEGCISYGESKEINAVRNKISMMTQKPYLFNTTVIGNIISGLKFRKENKEKSMERINSYLSYFNIKNMLDKNAKKLSGGEGAAVALLRTAVLETEIVLLDEPTASMDLENTKNTEKLIKAMLKNNRTVILVTHDFEQARRISDVMIIMENGRIIEASEKK